MMLKRLLIILNVFYLCKSIPIHITEHPQSQIAVPGSLVKLQCEYTTDNLYSSVTVHWLFHHHHHHNTNTNFTPITSTSAIRASHTTLTITSFNANTHAGLYKCLVNSSRMAVVSQAANLSTAVLEPFSALATEHTVSISEGNVAIISCPLPRSNPAAVPLFFVNDELLPLGHDIRYKIFTSGNLQIVNVRQSDSGVYKCSARNTLTNQVVHSAARTTLKVHTPVGTRLPRIVYVAGDTSRVAVGANLTLECVADGAPVPLVSWEKFGGVLPAGRSRQIFGNLVIVDVQPEDKGTYVCRAENGPGQATFKTAMLDVHQPPRVLKNEQFIYNAAESQQVRLTCPVLSDPRTTHYQWFHNGLLLPPLASMHKISLEKNRSVLTLRATDGVFQCAATSEFGTVQADLLLNVAASGVNKQRAQIILGPQNTSIYEGQSVVLLCVTSGSGVQINWLQNDLIIEPTLMRRFEINQQLGNLRIVSVQKSDAGLYKCIASNELGMNSAEAYVNVMSIDDERKKDKQSVLSNTRPIVQQIGTDKILLKWRLADNQHNQISFFKVEYKDQMNTWLTIDEQIDARKRQYILTDLALNQVYKFRLSILYQNGQLAHSHPSAKFRLDKSWQSHSLAHSTTITTIATINFKLNEIKVQIAQIWAISSTSLGLKWNVLTNNLSLVHTKIDGFYIYYRRLEPMGGDQEDAVPLYNYTRIQVPLVDASSIDSYLIANLQPASHYQIKMTCYNLKGDLCSFSNAIYGLTLAPTTTQSLNNNNSQMHRQVKSSHSEILFMILGAVLAVLSLLLVAFVIMCVLKNKERSKMLGQSLKLASSSCPTLIYEDSLRQNNRVNMYIGSGGNDSNSTNSQSMSTTTSSMTTPAASDHLILLNGQTVSANSFANLPVPPPPPQQSATINRINLNMNPLNENFYHTLTQLKDNGDHADYNNPTMNMRNLILKQQQQQQQLLMNTLKSFNMHYCDKRTKSPSSVKRTASKKSKKAKSESRESGNGAQQQQLQQQQQANYYLLPNCLPTQPMLYNDMEMISAAFLNQNLASGNLVFSHQPKQMCSFEQVASPINANLMDLFDKANEQIASDLNTAVNSERIYEQTEMKSDESEPMLNAHYATTEIKSLDEQSKPLCDHVQ